MPYGNVEKRARECHAAPAAWKAVIPPISYRRKAVPPMGRPSFFPLARYCIRCIPGTEAKGADHRLWRSAPTGLQTARASSVDCQSYRARRCTGPITCTGNSWLTAGAAAKRRLVLQCGFSRSAVKGD